MNYDELRQLATAALHENDEWGYERDAFTDAFQPDVVLALLAIRDAADCFALAWSGEQAARSAGMPLLGFPVVDAYQALTSLLWDAVASVKGAGND